MFFINEIWEEKLFKSALLVFIYQVDYRCVVNKPWLVYQLVETILLLKIELLEAQGAVSKEI